ncbi:MAG: hypothetical protein KF690_11920, partial [Bacteroidetes bacterium]|nr:hypothetical protein [Bacteroidota bacterium]
MYWKFSLRHPSVTGDAWTEVEEPIGWDSAEITLARDAKWHGIGVTYSLPVKFYGQGYAILKQVHDLYATDEPLLCRVAHRTSDEVFAPVFQGRLNMGGVVFSCEDGLMLAEANLEEDGAAQVLRSRMEAQVDLRSRRSLDSAADDLPAYDWADYDLTLLPQALIRRTLLRHGLSAPYAYDMITGFGPGTAYNNWLHDPVYIAVIDEQGGAQSIAAPYQSGIGTAYPLTNRSPVFRVPEAFSTLKLKLKARYRVEIADAGFDYLVNPVVRYNTDPAAAPALVGGTDIWAAAPVLHAATLPGGTQTYTFDIDLVYDTPPIGALDYVFVNFGFGSAIIPPNPVPQLTSFIGAQEVRVFQEDFVLEILDYSLSAATGTKAILVNEALARMAESLTGGKVTALSNLFGRAGVHASQPLPAPSGLNGDAHNLALAAGLQIRRLPVRPDASGNVLPTPLFTSLQALLSNLDACYNIGWALEEVPSGATLPAELTGIAAQVLRVETKRYFYQYSPVVKVLQAIREYELRPLEKELYTRVEGGYDKFETESLNGLEEFNTRWEYQANIQRSESALNIRCSYIAGGYLMEKIRRIDPDAEGSTDNPHDNDVFFIATARSSGTHFDGEPYAPLVTSERAENCIPAAPEYAPEGNLIDGRRAYNLRLAPQRNFIRWLNVLFAPLKPHSAAPVYRTSKVEGNAAEYFLLDDDTLADEEAARNYDPASQYISGRNAPFYETTELRCQ